MKIRKPISLCLSILLLGCDGEDTESSAIISYPSTDHISVQAAIDSLPDGGTILLEPGTYSEDIAITNKVIHLQGYMKQSIIDGQGRTCMTVTNASGSSISGMSFVNCNDGISTNSLITIKDNRFFNNVDGVDYESGGGLLDNNMFHGHKDDSIDLDGDVSVVISNNYIAASEDDGIEIRLHPFNGEVLETYINNNIFISNKSNGIQFIDYEVITSRSFTIEGNTFTESGFNEISYSDNQISSPSFNIGDIEESIIISNNIFYPSVYSLTGSGDNTVLINNFIYSLTGDGNINSSNVFPADDNVFIQLN